MEILRGLLYLSSSVPFLFLTGPMRKRGGKGGGEGKGGKGERKVIVARVTNFLFRISLRSFFCGSGRGKKKEKKRKGEGVAETYFPSRAARSLGRYFSRGGEGKKKKGEKEGSQSGSLPDFLVWGGGGGEKEIRGEPGISCWAMSIANSRIGDLCRKKGKKKKKKKGEKMWPSGPTI